MLENFCGAALFLGCTLTGFAQATTTTAQEATIIGRCSEGGAALHHSKRFTLVEELYFDQALGPAAKSARYLLPWTTLQFQFM